MQTARAQTTQNQIDHITIDRKWRRSLQDVRAKRGADAASDHQLVIAVLKLKLKAYRDQADRPAHRFNVQHLKNKAKAEEYKVELKNRFEALSELDDETVENHWQEIKKTWNTACQQVLGKRTRELKEWISPDSWNLIKERKEAKQKINHTQDQARKEELQGQYRELNQKVKRSTKQDKKNFIHELTEEAETAAGKGDMKRLYNITRTLSGKNRSTPCPVKDKDGKAITCEAKQKERWAEHFKEILNRPPPPEPPEVPDAEGKNIKEVDKFTYLGSVVDKHGGIEEDIKSRTNKARFAFNSLRPIWNSSALSIRNKLRIFNTNVKSVLLYGSETWRTTKTNTTKLQTFINRCLKYILKVRWPQTISNEELWRRSEQTPIDIQIKKRKWVWIGHTLRKPSTDITRQSLEWNPQGKRKVGRPKQTWRRSMEAEIRSAGKTWTELKRDAQNRVRWRGVALA
ncbi:hypothetical protein EGW08_003516 [Elysia chlorotica]|uniref:DUF6451 domain-containing protein n=1 Tax=Elysia chlorotica TaxID=188477 RepID=A0A433U4H3_ELYCH|nr:hypothetical protein EGW08_003516 [Elysia chlorotica]